MASMAKLMTAVLGQPTAVGLGGAATRKSRRLTRGPGTHKTKATTADNALRAAHEGRPWALVAVLLLFIRLGLNQAGPGDSGIPVAGQRGGG